VADNQDQRRIRSHDVRGLERGVDGVTSRDEQADAGDEQGCEQQDDQDEVDLLAGVEPPCRGRRERPRIRRQRAGVAVLTAALVLLVVFFAFASQRTQTIFGVNWVGLGGLLVVAGIAIVARRRH
jgi:hypothetical protein